jgi:hypothetical protein
LLVIIHKISWLKLISNTMKTTITMVTGIHAPIPMEEHGYPIWSRADSFSFGMSPRLGNPPAVTRHREQTDLSVLLWLEPPPPCQCDPHRCLAGDRRLTAHQSQNGVDEKSYLHQANPSPPPNPRCCLARLGTLDRRRERAECGCQAKLLFR